jgi:outer membrane protein OmpA-like peptidoglycan-associated protein
MNMFRTYVVLVFTLCLTSVHYTTAQFDTTGLRFDWSYNLDTTLRGVFGELRAGPALHLTPELRCLEDGACVPFTGGLGFTMGGALGYEHHIMRNWSIVGTAGLHLWSASMSATDASLRVRLATGEVVPLTRELTLGASGTRIDISVGMQYHSDKWRIALAPSFMLNMGDPTWKQESRILEPPGIRYPNGSTSQVVVPTTAIVNAVGFRVGARATAGYDIQLSKSITLTPSIIIGYTPMSIVSSASWSDIAMQGGVQLRFDASSYPDTIIRRQRIERIDTVLAKRFAESGRRGQQYVMGIDTVSYDTLRRELVRYDLTLVRRVDTLLTLDRPTKLNVKLGKRAVSLINKRQLEGADTAVINEQNRMIAREMAVELTMRQTNMTFATMPFVFFDSAQARVPDRYRQLSETGEYVPGRFAKGQHDIALDVMNVMGYRLSRQSDTIVIRGYADRVSEASDCDLARRRAESVQQYIATAWKVDPARLKIEVAQGSCSPESESNPINQGGREENRRVEFFAANRDYFMPVVFIDLQTLITTNLDSMSLELDDKDDPVVRWQTEFLQGENTLFRRTGNGAIDTSSLAFPREAKDKLNPDSPDPIFINFAAYTRDDDTVIAQLEIPIEKITDKIKLRSLSLAMFSVRSADISDRDRDLVAAFAERLSPGDRVSAFGYTDELGSADLNQQLAIKRARNAAGTLAKLRPDVIITKVEGVANARFPVGVTSYGLPEQRFMSRTVQLEVEE